MTILLLHSVVPLYFFSHLMFLLLHWAVPNDRTFVTINGSFLFFIFFYIFLLIFDRSIVTLSRTNITYGRSQPNPMPSNYLIIDKYV